LRIAGEIGYSYIPPALETHWKCPLSKLLLLSQDPDQYLTLLGSALPELEIVTAPAADCDLAFGDPSLFKDVIPHLPRLKWLQSTWAGVEPLLAPALPRNYTLTNARGVFGSLMSEFVFGYLLLYERNILRHLESQKQNRWSELTTGSLRGKTLGLMGVGSIGAHVAGTAKHFGMSVRGFTRASEVCPDVDVYFHADLPAFAAGLDYLVNILPNTRETRQLIDASALAALPARALFLNVGRGSAVDESALAEALSAGRLRGAVLDVFQQEPLPPEHIFWRTPNLIITSHTAAPSFPADIAALFIENYQRYARGEPLKYQVNFERGY
jgi:phosphoglycerate dehydrogenase-like enzyme